MTLLPATSILGLSGGFIQTQEHFTNSQAWCEQGYILAIFISVNNAGSLRKMDRMHTKKQSFDQNINPHIELITIEENLQQHITYFTKGKILMDTDASVTGIAMIAQYHKLSNILSYRQVVYRSCFRSCHQKDLQTQSGKHTYIDDNINISKL